jgi:hypothetical protein
MELTLQGIYLRDGLLWMSFQLKNETRIAYRTDYLRCIIRQKKRMKRMAVQEMTVQAVIEQMPPVVAGDSVVPVLLGFRPFTLSRAHQLVIQLAEREGGRDLELLVRPGLLLKTK